MTCFPGLACCPSQMCFAFIQFLFGCGTSPPLLLLTPLVDDAHLSPPPGFDDRVVAHVEVGGGGPPDPPPVSMTQFAIFDTTCRGRVCPVNDKGGMFSPSIRFFYRFVYVGIRFAKNGPKCLECHLALASKAPWKINENFFYQGGGFSVDKFRHLEFPPIFSGPF